MDAVSIATTAAMQTAAQNGEAFGLVAVRQQLTQDRAVADLVTQSTENAKAMLAEGVGGKVDKSA